MILVAVWSSAQFAELTGVEFADVLTQHHSTLNVARCGTDTKVVPVVKLIEYSFRMNEHWSMDNGLWLNYSLASTGQKFILSATLDCN